GVEVTVRCIELLYLLDALVSQRRGKRLAPLDWYDACQFRREQDLIAAKGDVGNRRSRPLIYFEYQDRVLALRTPGYISVNFRRPESEVGEVILYRRAVAGYPVVAGDAACEPANQGQPAQDRNIADKTGFLRLQVTAHVAQLYLGSSLQLDIVQIIARSWF